MSVRTYLWLFLAGLAVNLAVAALQHSAGYMDADYYYAGGIRLVQGHGFSDLAIWNYLNDPKELPSPSHGYWYPLASLLAAGGMLVIGSTSYPAARTGFVLVAAFIPPLTAALAYRLTRRSDLALTAGALALLPTYFTAFIPVTDNYGVYMALGASFFLLMDRGTTARASRLPVLAGGLCAGLMNLARSDGLLWALAGILFIALRSVSSRVVDGDGERATGIARSSPADRGGWATTVAQAALFFGGYLLLMVPWYARNYSTWGALLAPGGARALMLRTYADTFAFPASRLSLDYLLGVGWPELLAVRLRALLQNLDATWNLQISLFLLPFALVGLWVLRRETIVQVGLVIWLVLLAAMSALFPFAGPRGSFAHSTASLYSLWWSAGVAGIGAALSWSARHGWTALTRRRKLVLLAFVLVNALFSIFLVRSRVISLDWDRFERVYTAVEARLLATGTPPTSPVMVVDPPAYYTATGRPAIVVPDEETSTVMALAKQFGAANLVLESSYLRTGSLEDLYNSPASDPRFQYLGQVEDAKIYRINR